MNKYKKLFIKKKVRTLLGMTMVVCTIFRKRPIDGSTSSGLMMSSSSLNETSFFLPFTVVDCRAADAVTMLTN